jgi:hypothetical protein
VTPNSKLLGVVARHPYWGEGKIKDSRYTDRELLVEFKTGMRLWFMREDLEIVGHPSLLPNERGARPKIGKILTQRTRELRMIESLRLGIVPHLDVRDFTFGRKDEVARIRGVLDEGAREGGSRLIIEGEYGSGKTHILDYIFGLAYDGGFLVSKVEMDPFEISSFKPKRIYRSIATSLRFKDERGQQGTIEDLLIRLSEVDLPKPHEYLSPALELIRKNEVHGPFWSWIKGEPCTSHFLRVFGLAGLPSLMDYFPNSDNYCYILTALGHLAKTLGYKGFVILVDEAETTFHHWFQYYRSRYREHRFDFFRGLIGGSLNDSNLLEIGTTLIHSKKHPTPYLYLTPANLVLILAFTPLGTRFYGEMQDIVGKDRRIVLRALEHGDLRRVFEMLFHVYQDAYDVKLPDGELKSMLFERVKTGMYERAENLRFFIRSLVEAMDLMRFYPDVPPEQLLDFN